MADIGLRQIITANRLRDGMTVYFGGASDWSSAIADATSVAAGEGEALLQTLKAEGAAVPVVAPYVIEIDAAGQPVTLRERIRAFGPTA